MRRLHYELRAIGLPSFALPLAAVAIFTGVSLLAAFDITGSLRVDAHGHRDIALGLLYLLELGLPLVAGFVAAHVAVANPAKELHLALPTSYAAVTRRRLLLYAVWAIFVSGVSAGAIDTAGYWIAPQPAFQTPLIWLAPLVWFLAAGALLALALGSWVASTAVLGMLWIGLIFLRSYFLQNDLLQKGYPFLTAETLPGGAAQNASYWLANRLTLLALGFVFFAVAALLLRRNEALLAAEV